MYCNYYKLKMNKKDMSKLFKVSLKTLYNWEKNKPE